MLFWEKHGVLNSRVPPSHGSHRMSLSGLLEGTTGRGYVNEGGYIRNGMGGGRQGKYFIRDRQNKGL